MKKAIVVGSGAGGAVMARELQGTFQVIILEAGSTFRPLTIDLSLMEKIKKTGLLLDERMIQLFFKSMKIRKVNCGVTGLPVEKGMVMVNGRGTGGTTTLSTGSCLRADDSLRKNEIYLDKEFGELEEEIPITDNHRANWQNSTRKLFSVCQQLGLNPFGMPKMGRYNECTGCGHCVLGCSRGVKWDSRVFLESALEKGAQLITDCRVEKVIIEEERASAVQAVRGFKKKIIRADVVILAAGGLGTPQILEKSGITCKGNLFVDPVLCLAAEWKNCHQSRELPMPFIVEREGYIIAPYFDRLSFFFNKNWHYKSEDIISLMIKLADSGKGQIKDDGILKRFSQEDEERLKEAVNYCLNIFAGLGIKKEKVFYGTLNAGHPGGMMPLTQQEKDTLHHESLPENLFIADSSLLPAAAGKPLIMTIMALARRLSKIVVRRV